MRLLLTAILAVGLAAGAAWYFELWNPENIINGGTTPNPPSKDPKPTNLGGPLYTPAADPAPGKTPTAELGKFDPVTIRATLVVFDKWHVPSERDGELLFVGQEVPEVNPAIPGTYHTVTILQGNKEVEKKIYRRWQEDELVRPGQMLAMVNPILAMSELKIKQAEVAIAKEEYGAAQAASKEAKAQWLRADSIVGKGESVESVSIKKFYYDKTVYDEHTKLQAIKKAALETDKLEAILGQHTITNKMKGTAVIKHLLKHDSEAIKASEEIMELHNIEVLKAEGTVGSEYQKRLQLAQKLGKKITLDPVVEDFPEMYPGHTGEITGVAFGKMPGAKDEWLLISGSVDRTVMVRQIHSDEPRCRWVHPDEVTAVACSPDGKFCLSACRDGSLLLWDLSKLDSNVQPIWKIKAPGGAGITALTFSPDSKFFATGGEDSAIHVWDTSTGNRKYQIDTRHGEGHQGSITALQLTPQCRLVSAARDKTIHVWNMFENGATLHMPAVANRSDTVNQLGVSSNGQFMLFDRAKELHILSVANGHIKGILTNPMGTAFESLAVFSPDADASLLLTAGAPEGRLSLWKTPLHGGRPYEVRQWVPKDRSPATCAAFAPNAGGAQTSYALTGSRDGHMYLWEVPGRQEVLDQPVRNLNLDLVEQAIEGGTQVHIAVEVPNPVSKDHPRGKLSPGGTVTIVVE